MTNAIETTKIGFNSLAKIATCFAIPMLTASLTLATTEQAEAKTTRTANVVVQNRTGKDIVGLNLVHKYSNDYKEHHKWDDVLKSGADSSPRQVQYITGFLTTGQDWWVVNWAHFDDEPKLYFSDPNNFRGIVDALETAAPIAVTVIGAGVGAAAGAACTGTTAGACAPLGVAATKGAIALSVGLSAVLFNTEGTAGFKKHKLEPEDADKTVFITLKTNKQITISSPSGISRTVYSSKSAEFSPQIMATIAKLTAANTPKSPATQKPPKASKPTSSATPNLPRPELKGFNVNRVEYNGGKFEQTRSGWVEVNAHGTHSFKEVGRDEWSVYLNDPSRNVQIQLDLWRKMIGYGTGGRPVGDLYQINNAFN